MRSTQLCVRFALKYQINVELASKTLFKLKYACNIRWTNVRWAKVRWAIVLWAIIRWANVRAPLLSPSATGLRELLLDMTDDADMMRQRRQLYALGNVLSRRFHMCSIEVKNTLFRSFCTPMYTCQLWWNFSAQSMHKLNVAYNNAFRFMHHLPTYCSASLMFVVNCRAVIRNRIYGFMKRLVSSSNALVLSAVTSYTRFRSRIVRHWLKSLYIHFDGG